MAQSGGVEAIIASSSDFRENVEMARLVNKALWPLAGHCMSFFPVVVVVDDDDVDSCHFTGSDCLLSS